MSPRCAPLRTRHQAHTLLRSLRMELGAAVLRPRRFGLRAIDRALFAVGDGLDPLLADTERHQIAPRGTSAALAERDVVLARPAVVAVSFEDEIPVRMLLHDHGHVLQRDPGVRSDPMLVVREVDRLERRWDELDWCRRRRLRDRDRLFG